MESLHGQVMAAVAESRHLDPGAVDALADNAPLLRDDAVTGGLIDRIGFRDEAYVRIAELVGTERVSPETNTDTHDEPPRLYLARYAKATASRPGVPTPHLPDRKAKPAIAVVALAGPIVSGRGGPQPLPLGASSAGRDTIAAGLREAAADDAVAAVVLRVDSPGGSCHRVETIWREVARIRDAGKPVVASMGAVAASGGYYVSWLPTRSLPTPHDHWLDRRGDAASWWPEGSRSAWESARMRCAPTQTRPHGQRTRRSRRNSTHRSRPRPTCSTRTSCAAWPTGAPCRSRMSMRWPGDGSGPAPMSSSAAWSTNSGACVRRSAARKSWPVLTWTKTCELSATPDRR